MRLLRFISNKGFILHQHHPLGGQGVATPPSTHVRRLSYPLAAAPQALMLW